LVIDSLQNGPQIDQDLWQLWNRLCDASFFISKASAASLCSSIYPRLSAPLRTEMRRKFAQVLCGEECPIVRRAAAPVLSKLIEQVKQSEGKGKRELFVIVCYIV
jgi:hypothetical protein